MKKNNFKIVKIDKNKSLFNYEKKILINELILELKLGYYDFEKEKSRTQNFEHKKSQTPNFEHKKCQAQIQKSLQKLSREIFFGISRLRHKNHSRRLETGTWRLETNWLTFTKWHMMIYTLTQP